MGSPYKGYLSPKVGAPSMLRKERNGMFNNPPLYMELGDLSGSGKLMSTKTKNKTMGLESGPSARKGKPI